MREEKGDISNEGQFVTSDMLNFFYERQCSLIDNQGNPIGAPHDGSLALLALGHIGLIEWRKSRRKFIETTMKNKVNTPSID